MYLYMGLIAIIPGIIYFTYFIDRLLRSILYIHTNNLMRIIIAVIITRLSVVAMNTLELYGVVYYHLLVIMLILEGLNIWLKKYKFYRIIFTSGILGVLITALVFSYGYYNINHVVSTKYHLSSDKIDNFKIVEIADLHMSTSLDLEELKSYCDEISKQDADIIVLVGDIFDENTPSNDMVETCSLLASINNKQGIYYVYGNHDCNKFDADMLKTNLENKGIKVLDDEVISLNKVNIIGRKDARYWGDNPRMDTADLLKQINKNKYTILLDHQPRDLEENAKAGIDLQLSGHTHGGQLFPMRQVQTLFSDTLVYGKETINDFTAITTSGISGWRYPIKTGAKSEYVIIEIN